MKLSASDFEKCYAAMCDEKFALIKRQDLVDVARDCYDREAAHRAETAAAIPEVLARRLTADSGRLLTAPVQELRWPSFRMARTAIVRDTTPPQVAPPDDVFPARSCQ